MIYDTGLVIHVCTRNEVFKTEFEIKIIIIEKLLLRTVKFGIIILLPRIGLNK